MSNDTDALRDAIEAVKGGTPGPWHACGEDLGGCTCGCVWSGEMDCAVAKTSLQYDDIGGPVEEAREARAANALAIVAAVNFLRDHGDALLSRLTGEGFVLVPREPTGVMQDAAIELALHVKLSAEYGWHAYMRDLWATMLAAAPPALAPDTKEAQE